MRIRKNAKISAILYTNSNLSNAADECKIQKNLCQLNQSPWDIITFPSDKDSSSSFYRFEDTEVYYNVNVVSNGSSIGSIGDFESMASKTSRLGENGNISVSDNDYDEIRFKDELEKNEIQEEIKFCGKSDEKGWQCGSVVKNGNTMCDYHISELQNQAVWTTKKKPGPVSGRVSGLTTGARPRRSKKRPITNPHEFYYYSGFGPSWGKKRGSTCTILNEQNKGTTTSVAFNSNTSSVNGDIDVQEESGMRFEPDVSKAKPLGLGYLDDDEEEENVRVIIGKKRGRKPIKERSLKSLM